MQDKPSSKGRTRIDAVDLYGRLRAAGIDPRELNGSGLYQFIGWEYGVWYHIVWCRILLLKRLRPMAERDGDGPGSVSKGSDAG